MGTGDFASNYLSKFFVPARKKKIGDKQKEYRQKSGTTKDDGYFYDPTIDKKG